MKTATVRDVQHNLGKVLAWVEGGEEVVIYRRKRIVGKLVPAGPKAVASPNFIARAREVWGKKPRGKKLSDIVAEGRGER